MKDDDIIQKIIEAEINQSMSNGIKAVYNSQEETKNKVRQMYPSLSEEEFETMYNQPRTGPSCLCNWKYESCPICNPRGNWVTKEVWE